MNHSIIGRVLLSGALLLAGVAHAETEDIPLPGDVQSAPVKTMKQSAHHEKAGGVAKHGSKHVRHSRHAHVKHKASKPRKENGGAVKARNAKATGNNAASRPLHSKKSKAHKFSKNNNVKKKSGKGGKKLH